MVDELHTAIVPQFQGYASHKKKPRGALSGAFSFACIRQSARHSIPVRSEGRVEVEVGDGAFRIGEPVPRADAEVEWNIEDTEIVEELSARG